MSSYSSERISWSVTTLASSTTFLVCTLFLIGTLFRIDLLTRLNPSGTPMTLLTALLLTLSAIALVSLTVSHLSPLYLRTAGLLGTLIITLSILVLAEYAFNIDLWIDIPNFPIEPHYPYPGRPAPETAVGLVLLGLAVVLIASSKPKLIRLSRYFSALAWVVPVISLTSHFFGADTLYSVLNFRVPTIGIAFNTAVCIILLSTAMLFVQAEHGCTKILVSSSLGGIMARRMLLTLFLAPPLIGTIVSEFHSKNMISLELAFALTALLTLAAMVALSWLAALHLERLEYERSKITDQLIQTREDVLAVVSHDLRNPLGAVLGYAGLIKEHLINNSEAMTLVHHLEGAAKKMESLSQELLDFAQIESGILKINPKRVYAADLLDDLHETFAILANKKGVHYVQFSSEKLPAVRADRERIFQAVSNIVGNSLKFVPKGGHIVIRAWQSDSAHIAFSISDDGPGVKAEILPHIFERYWKPKESSKSGVGLGLFIAKGIIDAHGGNIQVTSVPGLETKFEFTLPILDAGSRQEL